jgi:cytochrome c2
MHSFKALTISAFMAQAALANPLVPFFDPTMPVYATPVQASASDIIARGLLLRVATGQWVVFDQELLRPALWLDSTANSDPLSLETMAQSSWYEPSKRATAKMPKPLGKSFHLAPALPGCGEDVSELLSDPRPIFGAEPGRGSLDAKGKKFLGYDVSSDVPVLSSLSNGLEIKEWYAFEHGVLHRHLEVAAGGEILFLVSAGNFKISNDLLGAQNENSKHGSNHAGLRFENRDGVLFARLAASIHKRRVTLAYSAQAIPALTATPPLPSAVGKSRWPDIQKAKIHLADRSGPGWELDRIGLPNGKTGQRRFRPADIVFLPSGKIATVTFEGDVWQLDTKADSVAWRRIAAGLCEPLSIGRVGEVLQVFTRNGLVRLHDRNEDGETDFYENHSSFMLQPTSTRAYPLDMEIDSEGLTWCSFGGIAMEPKGRGGKIPVNPYSGSILTISPDGKKIDIISSHAREPFFALDPRDGKLAMSDQQGHYIPSSGMFPVIKGDNFGFGQTDTKNLRLPAVWIPHSQDTSSASPVWLAETGFKAWQGALLNISYGTGKLFLVRSGGEWPANKGAVIPLGVDTNLPLLHARSHPGDGSLWLAGFRIYDSRVSTSEGISRLRSVAGALANPVDAAIFQEGVVLTFESALDPASLNQDQIFANEWQYMRTPDYGSPRFQRSGAKGIDPLATGVITLSKDKKSVFIHIPDVKPTMQLEVIHPFRVLNVKAMVEPLYFSASELSSLPWAELGFEQPKLNRASAEVNTSKDLQVPASAEQGREIVTRFGCIACHSLDGKKEGHSGPTWKDLYGSKRKLVGGKTQKANDAYLKAAILNPEQSIVEGYQLGMASYAGVLSDKEIDSIILFIKGLK